MHASLMFLATLYWISVMPGSLLSLIFRVPPYPSGLHAEEQAASDDRRNPLPH